MKNRVLLPYVNSPATRWNITRNPITSLNFSHLVNVTFFFFAKAENWISLPLILDILYLEYRISVIVFRCAFRYFVGFFPQFLYLEDEHGT